MILSSTINVILKLIKKFVYICYNEKKIDLIMELLIFAMESKFKSYRCYKLLKIFYILYSENDSLKKDFLNELIKRNKHESFVIKFQHFINFFNDLDIKDCPCNFIILIKILK